MIANKRERVLQIYDAMRTARLNVLYYGESLKRWGRAIRVHDIVIALTGAGSPIAFWKHSQAPLQQQAWFYLTLVAGTSAILKPILRWENQLKLFTELHTHYCDIYLDLKWLIDDVTAQGDLSQKQDNAFHISRNVFKKLQEKEPLPNNEKIERLMKIVNKEVDINEVWLPPKEEVTQ